MMLIKGTALVVVTLCLAAPMRSSAQHSTKGGSIVQHDAEIAKQEPGTHNGGGQTIGYSFFDKTPGMNFVFRKRALKPGSGIGYHEQKEDEVYYVLSGKGVMTLDEKPHDVTDGTAILTRPGSSHGMKQVGDENLVVMIAFERMST